MPDRKYNTYGTRYIRLISEKEIRDQAWRYRLEFLGPKKKENQANVERMR